MAERAHASHLSTVGKGPPSAADAIERLCAGASLVAFLSCCPRDQSAPLRTSIRPPSPHRTRQHRTPDVHAQSVLPALHRAIAGEVG